MFSILKTLVYYGVKQMFVSGCAVSVAADVFVGVAVERLYLASRQGAKGAKKCGLSQRRGDRGEGGRTGTPNAPKTPTRQ